jgi:diaminohydroxyphosphoribosylaminopyrimidine deaminase / 5-amino-6-(5-phosphoribosylamino)uracil reductase
MAAAVALSKRGLALTGTSPNVGCLLVKHGRVVGRGWTQPGGRPHAEAEALAAAGEAATGATAYVTLEPCAHSSDRGPTCTESLIAAGVTKVVIALTDPDPRTNGQGAEWLRKAGVVVEIGVGAALARAAMAGWLSQMERGRPLVTLKLATSLDGCIATSAGESQWITGDAARAHGHLQRARSNMILVGRGTYNADRPTLDVRLPGLEDRSPLRVILSRSSKGIEEDCSREDAKTRSSLPDKSSSRLRAFARDLNWIQLTNPQDIFNLPHIQYLLVEGGAQTAASFMAAGLVDRILLYRAPIFVGAGKACLADIGLASLNDAHGRWVRTDTRQLGSDSLDVYEAR